jgi:hypothetical protein
MNSSLAWRLFWTVTCWMLPFRICIQQLLCHWCSRSKEYQEEKDAPRSPYSSKRDAGSHLHCEQWTSYKSVGGTLSVSRGCGSREEIQHRKKVPSLGWRDKQRKRIRRAWESRFLLKVWATWEGLPRVGKAGTKGTNSHQKLRSPDGRSYCVFLSNSHPSMWGCRKWFAMSGTEEV